ncbi:hypothetical protein B0H34DRAFT_670803 [Crassisporium funariophilum]|nr:hypothetical protein B0H34DRAFT_670803 [Crassisporium funariophilum]
MPTLWSSIFVSAPTAKDVAAVRVWLDRARGCLLSLNLFQSLLPDLDEQLAIQDILGLYVTRVSRWRAINFQTSDGAPGPLSTLSLRVPPYLESATLDFSHNGRPVDYCMDSIWKTLHSSPSLHQVDYTGTYSNHAHLLGHTPWTQLIEVNLQFTLTMGDLLDIFFSCQRIRSLCISYLVDQCAARSSITLKLLRRFNVKASMVSLINVYDSLVLPALEEVQISQHLSPSDLCRGGKAFVNLLARSRCALKCLSITDVGMMEEHLLEYLVFPQLEALTHLSIVGAEHVTDKTIDLLTRDLEDVSSLQSLPRLLELSLDACSTSQGVLSRMVSSRLIEAGGRSLLRIVLLETVNGHVEELRNIQEMDIGFPDLRVTVYNKCHD